MPALLSQNLEQNLDYFVLLSRLALLEAQQHGQEVVPVSLAELDDETREFLKMTEFADEEPKSSDENIEGEKE